MDASEGRPADRQREAELLVAEAVGSLIEFWGFRGVLGRIWAALFLSEAPLTAAELRDRLGLSAGAVSMALTELERWGVLRRRRRPGDRREFFEPETDIWKMVSKVWRERELDRIALALTHFARARELLEVPAKAGDATERRRAKFARDRTERLIQLATVGQSLLRAFVDRGRMDVGPLLAWARSQRTE